MWLLSYHLEDSNVKSTSNGRQTYQTNVTPIFSILIAQIVPLCFQLGSICLHASHHKNKSSGSFQEALFSLIIFLQLYTKWQVKSIKLSNECL